MMDFKDLESPENVRLIELIPDDVLSDVPEEKIKEFKRGVILYFYKELPALLEEIDASRKISAETAEKTISHIRQFAEMIRAKKMSDREG